MAVADHPSRAGIKSVEVAYRLLDALAQKGGPLPLKELARAASMSPSKAHRYLVSLFRVGLIQQNPHTRFYELGPAAVRISLSAVAQSAQLARAIRLQGELRDTLKETVVLTVWGGSGPTILHIEDSEQAVHMTMKVGAMLPILSTAAGRVFATYLPQTIVQQAVLAQLGEDADAAAQAAALERLAATIREVRQSGIAVSIDEYVEGVTTIAVPFSAAVMGRTGIIDHATDGRIAAELRRVAERFRQGT